MPITPKHAFKEKSTKLLILLPLRTIYNRTFQCETPCSMLQQQAPFLSKLLYDLLIFFIMIKTRNLSGNVLLTYIQFLWRGAMPPHLVPPCHLIPRYHVTAFAAVSASALYFEKENVMFILSKKKMKFNIIYSPHSAFIQPSFRLYSTFFI